MRFPKVAVRQIAGRPVREFFPIATSQPPFPHEPMPELKVPRKEITGNCLTTLSSDFK
jgi:hypothetical protein